MRWSTLFVLLLFAVGTINPWMTRAAPVNCSRAMDQWETLREAIEVAGGKVDVMEPDDGEELPDLVFVANAAVVRGKKAFLATFSNKERQGETALNRRWFERGGYEVYEDEKNAFQGPGDALFADAGNRLLFCGIGPRSGTAALPKVAQLLSKGEDQLKAVACRLVSQRFYHIDVAFCPLNAPLALWHPTAFDDVAKHNMSNELKLISIPDEEANKNFACNVVVANSTVIMNKGNPQTATLFRQHGYQKFVDMSEFIKIVACIGLGFALLSSGNKKGVQFILLIVLTLYVLNVCEAGRPKQKTPQKGPNYAKATVSSAQRQRSPIPGPRRIGVFSFTRQQCPTVTPRSVSGIEKKKKKKNDSKRKSPPRLAPIDEEDEEEVVNPPVNRPVNRVLFREPHGAVEDNNRRGMDDEEEEELGEIQHDMMEIYHDDHLFAPMDMVERPRERENFEDMGDFEGGDLFDENDELIPRQIRLPRGGTPLFIRRRRERRAMAAADRPEHADEHDAVDGDIATAEEIEDVQFVNEQRDLEANINEDRTIELLPDANEIQLLPNVHRSQTADELLRLAVQRITMANVWQHIQSFRIQMRRRAEEWLREVVPPCTIRHGLITGVFLLTSLRNREILSRHRPRNALYWTPYRDQYGNDWMSFRINSLPNALALTRFPYVVGNQRVQFYFPRTFAPIDYRNLPPNAISMTVSVLDRRLISFVRYVLSLFPTREIAPNYALNVVHVTFIDPDTLRIVSQLFHLSFIAGQVAGCFPRV